MQTIRLSPSHVLGYEYDKLTMVDLSYFLCFFNRYFFFNFIFQHRVNWELSFIYIYIFNLFSIVLSWSHDLDGGFDKLTRVNLGHFFNWFFFSSFILQYWVYWELSFIIYFNLFSIGLSWWSHDLIYKLTG
jgi:hypothetical protein